MYEVLRYAAVRQAVGLSRTTLWRLERQGGFPARRQLSANSVGWLKSDVDAWIQSRAVIGGASSSSAPNQSRRNNARRRT